MHFLRECWNITCSVNPVHYWFVFERLLLNTYSVCIIMLKDEYWQNHPELHDVPIYYASQLAKKCMSGTVRTWLYMYKLKVHVLNLAGVNYFNMSTEVNVLISSWVHIWIAIIHKVNMLCIFCPHKIIASNFAVFQTYVNAMNEKIKKQVSC